MRAYAYTPPPEYHQIHKIRVADTKSVSTADGHGTLSVGDGETEHTVEVVIDMEAIVRVMGYRAVKNRSGKCMDGFVEVRRVGKGKKL